MDIHFSQHYFLNSHFSVASSWHSSYRFLLKSESVAPPALFFLLKLIFANWGLLWFHIGEGNGTPLQDSCLENSIDGGAWWAAVHGVTKSRTRLNDFTFTFHFHALEKEMATHSSVLAWRIPGTGDPGGLPSMGSHRVGHDWSDLSVAAAVVPYEFLDFFFLFLFKMAMEFW